jgi:hypothetical protein
MAFVDVSEEGFVKDAGQGGVECVPDGEPDLASGGRAGFKRANAARNRDLNTTKLRTLNPAWRPPFSYWEKGRG